MSKTPFDEWAPAEIARLRAQADALQCALDLYAGAEPRGAPASAPKFMPERQRAFDVPRQRTSKYESMFQAFEASGRALSLDEMLAIAGTLGFTLDRANMRSMAFAQKQLGRVRRDGDGYRWGTQTALETDTAPPVEGDAAQ